jgi:hypothetical protein
LSKSIRCTLLQEMEAHQPKLTLAPLVLMPVFFPA